jgi:hypothetical protein
MKLHTKLLVAFVLLASLGIKAHATTSYSLQLQLMIDTSASINKDQFDQQIQGYVSAFKDPDIQNLISRLPNGMVASVAYFSTTATPGVPTDPAGVLSNPRIDWYSMSSAADASLFADEIDDMMNLPYTDNDPVPSGGFGKTNIADAVQFGRNNIVGSGITAAKRIIDVSTDGIQNIGIDGVSVIPSCEAMSPLCIPDGGAIIKNQSNLAAADGITVNAIFIGGAEDVAGFDPEDVRDDYLIPYVITDDGFALATEDFGTFEDSIKLKLETEIASAIPIPAAVWLFASALVGLVAKARIKRTTA